MSDEDNSFVQFQSLIEDWSLRNESFFKNIGANPHLGRILSIILIENKPMTQEEIANRLNISKASVYRCVKILNEKWKIIERTRVPDSRKWHYSNRENPQVDLIISVILSLLDTFRNHQVALEGIISQYNSLNDQTRYSDKGKRFQIVVEEMNQSTRLIGEELTNVVKNLQQQYKSV